VVQVALIRLGIDAIRLEPAPFFLHAPASFGILLGPFAMRKVTAKKGARRREALATKRLGLGRFVTGIV